MTGVKAANARVAINPDDFLETADGRVWTPERNAAAWEQSYGALEQAIISAQRPLRVIVVCGVQGSGKSTWIASQPNSSNAIFVDAALPGIRHRARIIAITKKMGVPVDAVWIKTSLAIAIERNSRRSFDKVVPVATIQSVADRFEEPTTAEGFAAVSIVNT